MILIISINIHSTIHTRCSDSSPFKDEFKPFAIWTYRRLTSNHKGIRHKASTNDIYNFRVGSRDEDGSISTLYDITESCDVLRPGLNNSVPDWAAVKLNVNKITGLSVLI